MSIPAPFRPAFGVFSTAAVAVSLAACADSTGGTKQLDAPGTARDMRTGETDVLFDAADASPLPDGGSLAYDAAFVEPDGGPTPTPDGGPTPGADTGPTPATDGGPTPTTDGGPTPGADAAVPLPDGDRPSPDAARPAPDAAPPPPDAARPIPDAAPPPPPIGVTPIPCSRGPGSTLFRLSWFGGSHSPQVDAWAASCDYSLAPDSACNALPICRGAIGCEVGVTDGGDALLLDGDNQYLQVRFDVTGLQFQTATVYMEARGANGPTNFDAWSPIYGGLTLGPVAGDFNYQSGQFDWTGYLMPGDDPGLTALRITPNGGSLALHTVEMCLE